MRIAVTGATGFIGTNVIEFLLNKTEHEVVALSRNDGWSQHARLSVLRCDLYAKHEIDEALRGCDVAIYLVHSMSKPSSRFVQGDFQDFDFLLADNFARSAKKNGLKQIVYVSGLLPMDDHVLSQHLASRYEVEKVLHDQTVPVTALRCGMVIGKNGSSFGIVEKLVKRLPFMVLPPWVNNETQTVFIGDLVEVIVNCLEQPTGENRSYDVANPEILTYKKILVKTAEALKIKRPLINLPALPIWISRFWLTLVTGVSKQLVYPLVDSLVHELKAKPHRYPPHNIMKHCTPTDYAINKSVDDSKSYRLPVEWQRAEESPNEVQSVQRLPLPQAWSINDLAEEYKNWIPQLFRSMMWAEETGNELIFYALSERLPLLKLRLREDPSFNGRKLFDITGGWLAHGQKNGILEFREGLRRKFAIAVIFRYRPKLTWYLYLFTQAPLHAWVMKRFAQHLQWRIHNHK